MGKPYMCGDKPPVHIPDVGCDCSYTIEKDGTTYKLMTDGEQAGVDIDVPNISESEFDDLEDSVASLASDLSKIRTIETAVTFSSGNATLSMSGVSSDARVLITRKRNTASSLCFAGLVNSSGNLVMTAYDASQSADYSGAVTLYILIDDR